MYISILSYIQYKEVCMLDILTHYNSNLLSMINKLSNLYKWHILDRMSYKYYFPNIYQKHNSNMLLLFLYKWYMKFYHNPDNFFEFGHNIYQTNIIYTQLQNHKSSKVKYTSCNYWLHNSINLNKKCKKLLN